MRTIPMLTHATQFLFAFTSNGFVNHMRANCPPLLHLLLLDSRGDGPYGCRAFLLSFFSK